MVCACFYDENDNFRNKLWVLTSYDASRKEEDKLRKVVSEETAFKKEVNSSSPLQYSLFFREGCDVINFLSRLSITT